MTNPGEVYHDSVFDSKVSIVSVGEDTILVGDRVGGEGTREVRREDWEHNLSVGRYEFVKDYETEQVKMDKLEQEDYEKYVEMGEVEVEEEPEKGIFDY